MKILIVPNVAKPEALEVARSAAAFLAANGAQLLAEESARGLLPPGAEYLPAKAAYAACDIVLTIGGDGTLLHAAYPAMQAQKPLLGINSRRLGFLTVLEKNELEGLRRLLTGDYHVEKRSVLQARYGDSENPLALALNDVVLYKEAASKTISLDIYCDQTLVGSFRGDGVIFATPTGSTAYSMSAGGPVVDARLGGIVATQICAHIVHAPPMVFAPDRILRAVPRCEEGETVIISCDGRLDQPVPFGCPVEIRQAETTVPLVQFSEAGQLELIDKKMKWR